jgi:glycosyltransferase involved in cell wall biosynthesis
VILAEFSVPFAAVSWFLARYHRSVHVVDFFVGQVETHVQDRAAVGQRSLVGLVYRLFDWIALRSADIVISDTKVRATAIAERLRGRRVVLSLPVGAPEWARPLKIHDAHPRDRILSLLYYGNYIPLHGVDFIIEAIALLGPDVPYKLKMIGNGEQRLQAEKSVERLAIGNSTTFIEAVPPEALAIAISEADIVFGIFGTSHKAASVIANKVWQALACGKTVITRRSPALSEIEALVGRRLVQVPPNDPQKLADAIVGVATSTDLLQSPESDVAEKLEQYVARNFETFIGVLEARIRPRRPRKKV